MGRLFRLAAALAALVSPGLASAAWHEAKSKHFIIYANDNPDRLRRYAERLERFDQAVRHVRDMQDPDLTDSERLTIYALSSTDAVARLAGSDMVAGFYVGRASGSIAFVPRNAGAGEIWSLDSESIFFHEYAHHLQLQYSTAALPAWIIEGFAEFFATANVDKEGNVEIGHFPAYRAAGLFNTAGVSLEEILGGTYGRLNLSEMNELYGRAWLLTHYLSFDKPRRGQLGRYIDGIQNGKAAIDSARDAFGDLKQLHRELERYKAQKRLLGLTVSSNVLSVGPIQVRQLTEGEAAIMRVRLRSEGGVNAKSAPGVAADARRVAASFPTDAAVQNALAEAEYDAGNHQAAEAAADQALAADPKSTHAIIYKGRARLELAKKNPEKANWPEIRSWFIKANKLDTEDAEPLMLFYRSYVEAGQRPPKNAVEALLYATDLVPQDTELRTEAVQQLLTEERVKEARELFGPIAFNPHASPEWREAAVQVIAAMASGDADKALTALRSGLDGKAAKESGR